jgi:hypothetical protein
MRGTNLFQIFCFVGGGRGYGADGSLLGHPNSHVNEAGADGPLLAYIILYRMTMA